MIVAIVVLALAVGSQAQICCVPAQWEGLEGTVLGVSRADLPRPMAVTVRAGLCIKLHIRMARCPDIVFKYNTVIQIYMLKNIWEFLLIGENLLREKMTPIRVIVIATHT